MDSAVTQHNGTKVLRRRRTLLALLASTLMATGLVVGPSSTPAAEAAGCGLQILKYSNPTMFSQNYTLRVTNCNSYHVRWRVAVPGSFDGPCYSYRAFGGSRIVYATAPFWSSGPYLKRC